ncbi:MAG: benzoate degradation ring-cleavage hydrolase [Acidobacteria bacterium]|nr:benzoate degradation ring-cleavage hydrolase [Acidobacteriota bacterium]
MPFIALDSSPLAPGVSPVRIHVREAGAGPPMVMLHGGWGYDIYPFDRQIAALSAARRLIAPDRTGYGRSGRLERQETDFHHRAAAETIGVIDALGLDAPIVWGHSDGAVIALLMALSQPDRLSGIIVEATHFFRRKPASRAFFETMMRDPDGLGERVSGVLAREHGGGWRDLIRTNGDAWLRIAADPRAATADLYSGRLPGLQVPALVIHGARDPRTEPGELEALRAAMAAARFEIIADGSHSPHSERATSDRVTRIVRSFVDTIQPGEPVRPAGPVRPDHVDRP